MSARVRINLLEDKKNLDMIFQDIICCFLNIRLPENLNNSFLENLFLSGTLMEFFPFISCRSVLHMI